MVDNIYDEFFTIESIEGMSRSIKRYYPQFNSDEFLKLINQSNINKLPIMSKMRQVTLCLHRVMPASYENDNIRRYTTESCRPTHPWGIDLPRFKKDPTLVLPILEQLKSDPSEFVRRSVANNLNAISKNHPELIINITKSWIGVSKNTDNLLKHACRTLLKSGNCDVLELFGYNNSKDIMIDNFQLAHKEISIGQRMPFTLSLRINGAKDILTRVEYALYFLKKNGTYSRKVLKVTEKKLQPGLYDFKRKGYEFINRTTRKLYRGEHKIAIVINGVEKVTQSFKLV